MDIFKILSRSTKHSKGPQNAPATKLPSSGETINPQLFGSVQSDSNQQWTGKKRKRTERNEKYDTVLPDELNFFGEKSKNESSKLQTSRPKQRSKPIADTHEQARDDIEDWEIPPSLSEEQCRLELRNHKIKVTALEEFGTSVNKSADHKKEEKKRKKKKSEDIKDTKKNKKRLEIFPQPLTSFTHLRSYYDVSQRLITNIDTQGYRIPTEVQIGSLPLLLGYPRPAGNGGQEVPGAEAIDLLTVAPTGSGKTLTFLIHAINSVMREKQRGQAESQPRVLILAPTKELAAQIVNEGRKITPNTGVQISLMRKGMQVGTGADSIQAESLSGDEDDPLSDDDSESAAEEEEEEEHEEESKRPLKKRARGGAVKAHILVSTPLTLINSLKNGGEQVGTLPSVDYLVLDEADVLLDPLFRDQTMTIWTSCISPSLRISLWSATMSSSIEAQVKSMLETRQKTSATASSKLFRVVIGLKDTAIPNITHTLTYCATESGKLMALRQLLRPTAFAGKNDLPALRPPFLIFTQTIQRALALHAELLYDIPPEAGGSARIGVLHSTLSDSARSNILARFRAGEVWVLVTTDILARGLDFKGLNGVVNYDVPTSAAAYVHRVGRTGRAGRDGGVAVTLWAKEDIPHVKIIANVIAASEKLRKRSGGGNEHDALQDQGIQQWLLDALPTPSKRDKQRLKQRGVEARRPEAGKATKGGAKTTISTKVGGHGRKRSKVSREERIASAIANSDPEESDFGGFDDEDE